MMQQVTLTIAIFFIATAAALAANPRSLGAFGKWSAWTYIEKGSNRCFIYSKPTMKEPASLDHGAVAFFVRTVGKAAPTEASFQAGYNFASSSEIRAAVDNNDFRMAPVGNSAWLRQSGQREREFLRALENGREMTLEAQSSRGNKTSYRFSLDGVTKAMRQAQAACP